MLHQDLTINYIPALLNNTLTMENENLDKNQGGAMPKNYLIESILMSVLCCLPLGIVALIHETKVETEYKAGNYDAAQAASDEAAKWLKWGLIGGGIVVVLCIILIVVGGVAGAMSN